MIFSKYSSVGSAGVSFGNCFKTFTFPPQQTSASGTERKVWIQRGKETKDWFLNVFIFFLILVERRSRGFFWFGNGLGKNW